MKTRLLFALLFVSSLSFAQLPTDQVAKYTFTNGNLTNVVDPGNGNLSGGAVPSNLLRPDRFGNADAAIRANAILRNGYQFTGTNNEISISFWVQGSAPTSGNQRIFDVFDSSGDGFSMRTGPSNTLIARFKNSGNDNQSSQSGLSIYNGDWHQVVFTIKRHANGYDNRVYIDGNLHATLSGGIDSSNNSNFLSSNATFRISPINYYSNIDDVELFDRELTPVEVYSIYLNYSPEVKYVNQNATGNNDGSTWTDAYNNLQNAIDNASNNDQLWVASGTYLPTGYAVNSEQGTRDQTFLINKPLYIYGGFNGTETDFNQRDISANLTILSGDLNNDDNAIITTSETTRQDNVFHVVSLKGNFSTGGELDGFIVSGGNANSNTFDLDCATAQTQQYDNRRGAAIFKNPDGAGRKVFIKIKNCIIENNSALGMAVSHSMNPCGASNTLTELDFENAIIRNNYSVDYSNIYYSASAYGIKRYGSLINCLVYDNITVNQASALTLSADASHLNNLSVDIINSTFTQNSGNSTVINLSNASKANIFNTIIYGNNGASFSQTGQIPSVQNNLIENGFLGGTNQDPLFTDAVNGDFTLQSGSPAIDAGNNAHMPNSIIADLLGNNRIHNTTIDLGVYEFGASLGTNDFELNENQIKLYPNPTASVLTIKMNQNFKQATIYSVLGAEVIRTQNNGIDVSGLSNGVFIIKVEDKNGTVSTKRFIKK